MKTLRQCSVRAGYKKTELGVIPVDWDVVSYGEAFDFLSTATYSRADLSDNDEVCYVHYGDIHTTWNYFLDFKKNTLPTIEKEKVKNYSFIKDGDLIMADASEDYNGIGKSVEVKNITTNKAISGLHTFLLRGKEGIFVDGFKGYIHSNRIVKTSMDRLATGLKVYGVSKTNLKTILIPRPTLPEQTAIATVLSDTDALIERLEKLIAKKKAIKQGAMQQLLTPPKDGQAPKKRLPGFSGEWEVKKLGEIVDFSNGKAHENFISDDGEYIVVNSKFISSEGQVIKYSKQCFSPAPANSILLVMSDVPNGKAIAKCFFVDKNSKYTVNQRICALNPKIDARFLFYKINRNSYYLAFDDGVKQTNLRKDDVLGCKLSIPKEELEQTAIATLLSDMDAEIERLEQKKDKYTMLKQGMMQELLTGKTRLI